MKGSLNLILTHTRMALMIFLALLATPLPAAEPEPALEEPTAQLENVLKNVLGRNAQIQESVQDIEIARSQLDLAKSALFPRAEVLILAAPMPAETGNALHSDIDWNNWGPFLKGGAEIIEPLYTFGQISSYRRAAESQIVARSEQAEMKRSEVLAQAKEMYYGFRMASDLESLVDELTKFLEEAVNTAEKDVKNPKKKSQVRPHDLYRLKDALEDLRQKKLYASAARQTAEKAVGWISGSPKLALEADTLAPEKFEQKPLEEYLKMARSHRPEFRALSAGQQARLALRDAKIAQSYPAIFFGAFGSYGWSPNSTPQNSIFANDPFNRVEGGAGLGIKFDLEFTKHSAEAAEQEAEANKLKATEAYAVPGIELQVKKAYWELEQSVKGLEVAERRKTTGKKWFVSSAMGWSIGITPAKDLMEALQGNGLAEKNYIETVYSLNMALTHLTQAVGVEVADLRYR